MHKEIFKKFHRLNDSKWIDLLFKSVDAQIIKNITFPGFPGEEFQVSMIGNSGKNSLYEPKHMYQEIRRIAAQKNMQFNEKTTLLDFACGYGRNIRFFLKDIYPGNLFGSDVIPDFIDICNKTFSYDKKKNSLEVIFDKNNPLPPLRYNEKSFDIIMAYSLFSHLSEDAHLAWLNEFSRILKSEGLLFITIRQQKFLTDIQKVLISKNFVSDYEKYLAEKLGNDLIQDSFNRGEYIYNPSGGGPGLDSSFYGNTVIPDKYIHTKWTKWFDIIEHYDDPSKLPQAFICLMKKHGI